MKAIFGLLRLVRGIIGLVGVITLLFFGLSVINGSQEIGVRFASAKMLVVGFICLVLFGSIRWLINKLHSKKYGVSHPSLSKKWNL